MKTQIATDRDQSARLLACGVKPETADMCYIRGYDLMYAIPLSMQTKDDIPAWSLSCLLEILPKHIKMNNAGKCRLGMFCDKNDYHLSYGNNYTSTDIFAPWISTNMIECCIKAIEWLTSREYSLNVPKQ